ncbi:MAG: transposase, partial [Anaerovoracaceae bacterium]
ANFEFNLNDILAKLCYGRILSPSSKIATYEFSKTLIQPPDFNSHQVYRALDVLSKYSDQIQSQLYHNSLALSKRKQTSANC